MFPRSYKLLKRESSNTHNHLRFKAQMKVTDGLSSQLIPQPLRSPLVCVRDTPTLVCVRDTPTHQYLTVRRLSDCRGGEAFLK